MHPTQQILRSVDRAVEAKHYSSSAARTLSDIDIISLQRYQATEPTTVSTFFRLFE